MTKNEVIQLARQAAAKHGHTLREVPQKETVELLVEFFVMTTALAREECAKVCDALEIEAEKRWKQHCDPEDQGQSNGACSCAAAIRALNSQPLKPCRSPYCECDQGHCTHPGFYDARAEPLSQEEKCPVCQLPLKTCPSGLVCDNGHGF